MAKGKDVYVTIIYPKVLASSIGLGDLRRDLAIMKWPLPKVECTRETSPCVFELCWINITNTVRFA